MKLYKYELENFIAYLDKLKTDRTDTRQRIKFKGLLTDYYLELLNDTNDINHDYVVKDKEGNPIIENGKYTFKKDSERIAELNKLYNEVIVIDETEERKAMLLSVKESVINRGPLEFEGIEGDWYCRFCDIVEQINYEEQ
ncbi:hypothetical protein H6F38_23060 [Paenibacillus sp. EKM208P]|nr:hypothetical protein H6F38_23060 [Paenibacillus sp. EKM208P]